jgi:hypothetical protein
MSSCYEEEGTRTCVHVPSSILGCQKPSSDQGEAAPWNPQRSRAIPFRLSVGEHRRATHPLLNKGGGEWPERHARFSLPEAFFEGILMRANPLLKVPSHEDGEDV